MRLLALLAASAALLVPAATAASTAGWQGSFQASYDAASPGEVITVPPGSYGSVTISGSKAGAVCDGYTIGADLSKCVTFQAVRGTVTVSGLRPVAQGLRIVNVQTDTVFINRSNCTDVPRVTDIVLQNVSGRYMSIANASNVGILGGSWGPRQDATNIQMADCNIGLAYNASRIRFDGIHVHDAVQTNAGSHLECIQSFGIGTAATIIRNSKFTNCAQWAISGTFRKPLLIENNIFAEPCSGQASPPCITWRTPIALNCAYGEAGDITIRFNSIAGGLLFHESNCALKGVNRFYGNSTDWQPSQYTCDQFAGFGIQFSYNVYGTGGAACGSNAVKAGNQWTTPEHPTYDFSLRPGTRAIGFVPSTLGAPRTDINGDPRPLRLNADAGADQRDPASLRLGRSVGAVSLGQPIARAVGFYGPGRRAKIALGRERVERVSFRVRGGSLWALVDDGAVVGVGTTSAYYTTAEGFGVGSNASVVRSWGRREWTPCRRAFRHDVGTATVYAELGGKKGKNVKSLAMIRRGYDYGEC